MNRSNATFLYVYMSHNGYDANLSLLQKRKLSSAEYKEVDEQYRVANIKMITTNLAAQDLKKYGNALDKVTFLLHNKCFLSTTCISY